MDKETIVEIGEAIGTVEEITRMRQENVWGTLLS